MTTVSVALPFAIMTAAGFPGLMSNDSFNMWSQAVGERGLSSHHTPWLTALWSVLGASSYGPIGPFLLQQFFFWAGILLVAIYIYDFSPLLAIALGPTVLLMDASWVSVWLWKDASILSATVFGFGLFALSSRDGATILQRQILQISGAAFIGFAAASRWYMGPISLLLLLILVWFFNYSEKSQEVGEAQRQKFSATVSRNSRQLWTANALLVGVFTASYLSPLAMERLVLKPEDSFSMGHLFTFDLARVHCTASAEPAQEFPQFLLRDVTSLQCDDFNPVSAWSVLRPGGRGAEYLLRFPESNQEMAEVQSLWAEELIANAPVLAVHRGMMAVSLLRPQPWIPNIDLGSGRYDPMPGSRSSETGHPYTGQPYFILARLLVAPLSYTPDIRDFLNSGFFAVVILPFFSLMMIWRRTGDRARNVSQLLLALWPLSWVVAFAAVTPWDDTRYIAVASVTGWILSFLFFARFLRYRRLELTGEVVPQRPGPEGH